MHQLLPVQHEESYLTDQLLISRVCGIIICTSQYGIIAPLNALTHAEDSRKLPGTQEARNKWWLLLFVIVTTYLRTGRFQSCYIMVTWFAQDRKEMHLVSIQNLCWYSLCLSPVLTRITIILIIMTGGMILHEEIGGGNWVKTIQLISSKIKSHSWPGSRVQALIDHTVNCKWMWVYPVMLYRTPTVFQIVC